MCSNKSDVQIADGKLYNYHKSVLITPDIKYVMLVSYVIHTGEACPNV